jgi:asparagine synthase (glutamine-hydrolysing)
MCGICGFNWEDKKLVNDMVSIQQHRGPDQKGIFCDKNVSLGHARLSIIDLSIKGKQPMCNEDSSVWVTYNGEIYNFISIKKELEKKGHKFKSDTDTEVIVHAYEEYGEKCVSLFNGMFAFAIWDRKKNVFFIVRDKVGVKPLYYSIIEDKLIFASEMKAILLHEKIKREINKSALYNFLTFRYSPGNNTIFEGINKLEPGYYLKYDDKTKKGELKKYGDFQLRPEKSSARKYAKDIDSAMQMAVGRRLMSDVPLGAFLSGGLDSTYIVALMQKQCNEAVKTFSIGFDSGEGYNETKFSKFVAEYYNTDHHEFFIKENSFNLLPKIMWHMDEPIADFASIPTYILSEFAKKKVSVVLTGEGADELFGGYRKYKYLKAFHPYYKTMPLSIRRIVSEAGGIFNKSLFFKRIQDFHSAKSVSDYYLQLVSFFSEREKKELCNGSLAGRPDVDVVNPFFDKRKIMDSMMALDFKTWLPEDLLMKVDKTTMAHSLEARVPFLDSNVVNLGCKIPHKLKLRFNKEKYVLRGAMKGKVPRKIYTRKKHGFNVPVHRWLEKELKGISQELLSKKSVEKRGFFNHNYIQKLFNNYSNSKVYYSRQLWTLLNFEVWARIYLDRDDITGRHLAFDDIIYN